MSWVIAESTIEKLYIQVMWRIHNYKWYASPGRDYCETIKHNARMGTPGTNQVLFCNPEKNDLQWLIK
eukprot:11445182-Prorocentrum_lima.AAC.1